MSRILINLFSDIFSSLDWIFFSMHMNLLRKQALAWHAGPRGDRTGSVVCSGGSGAVYLSPQAEFCPGSARLQRDWSQRGVLPSWRGYLIFVLRSFAWLMPLWDPRSAAGSV